MSDLNGKLALITGASGGIGAAIAETLAAAGATVALTGTNKERLAATAESVGSNAFIAPANLADADAPAALVKDVEAKAGKSVDILVNNAGLTRDTLLMRLKEDDWQAVLNVNLSAAFRLSQAVLRGMMKARSGRIINITSIVGTTGNPGQTNYAASKAGLVGFSKSLALEVANRGVTVNCIAPGFIATAMTDKLNEQQRDAILSKIPMGSMGSPADIAAAAGFLAGEGGRYITGQTIHVNGGMAMV